MINITKYYFSISYLTLNLGLPDGSPDCVDKPTGHGGGTSPQVYWLI